MTCFSGQEAAASEVTASSSAADSAVMLLLEQPELQSGHQSGNARLRRGENPFSP